ncbi:MAG: ABC transporter ATP-binding protein [Deltaproteobacteria bacterium]|nr:MAG: ABC transporter ATP-binding protein [Deltaproteobacteria bacterium]
MKPREEDRGAWIELLRPAWPHRHRIARGALVGFAQSGVLLLVPWLAGRLAQGIVSDGGRELRPDLSTAAGLLALFGIHAVASYRSQYLIGSTEAEIAGELRDRIYERLQSLPLRWFQNRPLGDLLAVAATDVPALAAFAARAPVGILPLAVTLLGALVMMARIDLAIALVCALVFPPAYVAIRWLGRSILPLSRGVVEAHGQLFALLEENLEHLLVIKSFAREDAESRRHRDVNGRFRELYLRQLRSELRLAPVTRSLAAGAAVGIVLCAAHGGFGAVLPPGELVALLLYAALISRPVEAAANLYTQVQEARAARERVESIWREAPEARGATGLAPRPEPASIEFRDVSFAYAGRPPALRGLTLRIEPRERVALVGPNGSGKTTLAHLLLRLHEGWEGEVLVDGCDVRARDLASLRRQIGFAPQRVQLFNRSIRENIAFGRPDASPEAIEEAADRAGARAFIEALPEGYQTRVGEGGVKLSGGQGQRIALARALLTDPPILVLDEAMSMLDPDGERAFLERNLDWLRQRTVLFITHRPSSLHFADRVVAMREGRPQERAPAHTGRRTGADRTRRPERPWSHAT